MNRLLTIGLLTLALTASAGVTNVNTGTAPNDGTGDTLRTAFGKLNGSDNFLQAYALALSNQLYLTISTNVGLAAVTNNDTRTLSLPNATVQYAATAGGVSGANVSGQIPQSALPYKPQPASANLTNWATIAPSAKQDALAYQPATNGAPIAASQLPGNMLTNGQTGWIGFGIGNPVSGLDIVTDKGGRVEISSFGYSGMSGLSFNGSAGANDYNFLSATNNPDLYINRPAGRTVFIRGGNTNQGTIDGAGKFTFGVSGETGEKVLVYGAARILNGITVSGASSIAGYTPLASSGFVPSTLLSNVPLASLSGPLAGSTNLITYGDSITAGVGASVSDSNYVNRLSAIRAVPAVNYGVSGDMVGDAAWIQYAVPVTSQTFISMYGANDQRFYSNALQQADFGRINLEHLAWISIPNSQKILSTATNWTYTGTWETVGVWNGMGMDSRTYGDKANVKVYGSHIVVGSIGFTASAGTGGQFTIAVDGTVIGGTNSCRFSDVATQNGHTYMPFAVIITNLPSRGPHTVEITVVSPSGAYYPTYVNWIAGLDTVPQEISPSVFVGNIIRSSNYPVYHGSDLNVWAMSQIIERNVSTLANCGLNVSLVDLNATINPLTDLTDGLHPNDAGYSKIAAAYARAMSGLFYPRYRR